MERNFIQCLSIEEGAVLRKRFSVKLLLVLANVKPAHLTSAPRVVRQTISRLPCTVNVWGFLCMSPRSRCRRGRDCLKCLILNLGIIQSLLLCKMYLVLEPRRSLVADSDMTGYNLFLTLFIRMAMS